MNDSGSLALCFGQDNVNKVLGRGHRLDAFEVVYWHFIVAVLMLNELGINAEVARQKWPRRFFKQIQQTSKAVRRLALTL